jgi:acyl-CoA dehydrogenase
MATTVIDRAIEVFGAAGISDDTPLAYFYAWARALRIVDGPDAVHRRAVAREELRRTPPYTGAEQNPAHRALREGTPAHEAG